jgi:hypothetical protein
MPEKLDLRIIGMVKWKEESSYQAIDKLRIKNIFCILLSLVSHYP